MSWLTGDKVDADALYTDLLQVLNMPLDILRFDDDIPLGERPMFMIKLKDWFRITLKEYAVDGQLILYALPDTYLDLEGS